MKIVFFGDSFSVNQEGWPGMVVEQLGCDWQNYSMSGSSLDYCYMILNDYFEKNPEPDVVVITVTSSDRIYHDDHVILASGAFTYEFKPAPKEIRRAAEDYYTYLHSGMITQIRAQMFYNALSMFTLQHPKVKFIILPCFEPFGNTIHGNYVATGPRLMNFSELEPDLMAQEARGETTDRNNHLTRTQNEDLAKAVVDMINNYSFGRVSHQNISLYTTY